MKQKLRDAEDYKLTTFEQENVKEFYDLEIKNKNLE